MENNNEQSLFIEALDNLKEFAKVNGNIITKQDILDNFKGITLEDSQMQMIYGYLLANHIKIVDIEIQNNAFKDMLEREEEKAELEADRSEAEKEASLEEALDYEADDKFIQNYIEDLKQIEPISNNTESMMLLTASEGDKEAIQVLVTNYLPRILEWLNPYRRQGALASDLLQEGNLAVLTFFSGKQWIKTADWMERLEASDMKNMLALRDEVEQAVKANVEQVFEDFIKEQKASKQISQKVLKKVNSVNDWAKRLTEELGRKPTMEEVAEKMGITVDEVKEAIDLTSDSIEDISKGKN